MPEFNVSGGCFSGDNRFQLRARLVFSARGRPAWSSLVARAWSMRTGESHEDVGW